MATINRNSIASAAHQQTSQSARERPFEILGIGELEERAYRWMLAHPRSTAAEIAHALSLSPRKAQRLLDAIEAKGLSTHAPERPCRYLPASPDMALQALVLQGQKDLQAASAAAQELHGQVALQRQDKQEQVVELITSREAEAQVFEYMHRTAQHEVLTLIRPPLVVSRLDAPSEQDGRSQREAQSRGVHFRSIVDADFLALPGAVERLRVDARAGEDVRVFPSLPFKLLVADRRIAIIPLNLQQAGSPVLLVRSSSLLDALCELFEMLWQRATPISFTRSGGFVSCETASPIERECDELIPLMAAGFNDKAIAHELGLSLRTLNRRITDLTRSLDARTRFQAGWVAALRMSQRDVVGM
jgi:sugar-specific transcriptional regulator TrmB